MKQLILCGSMIASAGLFLASCGGGAATSFLSSAKSTMTKAEQIKAKSFLAKNQADITKINDDAAVQYRAAKVMLDKEVMMGSSSANIGEAWFLLGKTSKELNLSDSALMAFKEADKLIGKEKKDEVQMRSEMSNILYEVWITNVNKAVENYNAATGETDKPTMQERYRACIKNVMNCLDAKPENIDIIYSLFAASYQGLEDTAKALATQEKYLALNKPMVDALAAKGVQFAMQRDEAVKLLGQPAEAKTLPPPDPKAKTQPSAAQPEITLYYDKYTNLIPGKEMYIFYPKNKDKAAFLLDGFSIPPTGWSVSEKERQTNFDPRTYISTAYQYYTKKDYDKAIRYAEEGLSIKPTDEDLQSYLSTFYIEGGKTDLAMAKLKEKSEKNPNDKAAITQYGGMLANLERYDDAIAQFDKALKIDPKFETALFNIAAAYKNKASQIQKDEQKKFDDAETARKKDKKTPLYVMDISKYKPFLQKSADYFEEYRKLPGKDRDAQATNIVEQLLNVYDVLDNKEKYQKYASEFVALEYANQNNPRFYEYLARIYGKQKNNSAKVKECLDKADALRKGGAK